MAGGERQREQLVHLRHALGHHSRNVRAVLGLEREPAQDFAVGAVAADEPRYRRPAGIFAVERGLGDQDVRGAVIIDQIAPPAAAGTRRLGGVDQQGIDPHAADPDIVDRALRGAEHGPCPLPWVAALDAGHGRPRHQHRDQQHRRGPAGDPRHPEQLAGTGAVEKDAKVGDIAVRPDLLAVDDDRADQRIEHRIAEVRRFADRPAMLLGPQGLEALALGHAPTGVAGGICVLAADVDVDSVDFQRAGAVDGQNPAVARFHLGHDGGAKRERGERGDSKEGGAPRRRHGGAFGDKRVEIQARYR